MSEALFTCAALYGLSAAVCTPVDMIKTFSANLISYLKTSKPEYGNEIASTKKLEGNTETTLKAAIETVKEGVLA